MKNKLISSALLATSLFISSTGFADMGKGLNVLVTAPERQSQMMALVLSIQTIKKHSKEVNMVLCSSADDLALSETKTEALKGPNKSPTQMLKALIKMGGSVKVCPLYLPSIGKTKADLIEGITIAKPPAVAARILDTDYTNLSY